MADVNIPWAVEFLVYISEPVGGCGWLVLMKVSRMGHAHWVDMNMPPVSSSVSEDMPFLIVFHIVCIDVNYRVITLFSPC